MRIQIFKQATKGSRYEISLEFTLEEDRLQEMAEKIHKCAGYELSEEEVLALLPAYFEEEIYHQGARAIENGFQAFNPDTFAHIRRKSIINKPKSTEQTI